MMILNWQPLCLVLLYYNNCWPRHCSYFYTTAQIISGHLPLKSSSDISSSHFVCVLHVCVFHCHVTLLTSNLLCLKWEDSIEWSVTRYEYTALRWRHNDHAGVSNHQPHGCLLNRLFRRKSKKTSKLRVTGLCGQLRGKCFHLMTSSWEIKIKTAMTSRVTNANVRRPNSAQLPLGIISWYQIPS